MKAIIDGTVVRINTIWKSDHDEYVVVTDIKEFGIYIRFLDTGNIRWCDDRAFLRSFYEIEAKQLSTQYGLENQTYINLSKIKL